MQETSAHSKKLRRRTPLQQQAKQAQQAQQGKASTTTVDRCTSFLAEKENNLPCAACPATPELPCFFLACKKRRKLCTACPQPARLSPTQLNSAQLSKMKTLLHQAPPVEKEENRHQPGAAEQEQTSSNALPTYFTHSAH